MREHVIEKAGYAFHGLDPRSLPVRWFGVIVVGGRVRINVGAATKAFPTQSLNPQHFQKAFPQHLAGRKGWCPFIVEGLCAVHNGGQIVPRVQEAPTMPGTEGVVCARDGATKFPRMFLPDAAHRAVVGARRQMAPESENVFKIVPIVHLFFGQDPLVQMHQASAKGFGRRAVRSDGKPGVDEETERIRKAERPCGFHSVDDKPDGLPQSPGQTLLGSGMFREIPRDGRPDRPAIEELKPEDHGGHQQAANVTQTAFGLLEREPRLRIILHTQLNVKAFVLFGSIDTQPVRWQGKPATFRIRPDRGPIVSVPDFFLRKSFLGHVLGFK